MTAFSFHASYLIWFIAVTALLYVIAGYPVLLALLTGRRAPAVLKNLSFEPSVSIILAVYNGASQIRRKIEALLALDYPPHLLQIIVVSDGSTDETDQIVREYKNRGVALIRAPRGGKAAALNFGIEAARGEVIFFTDVRQPLDRLSLRHLVANLADPTVGAVTGELRLLKGDKGEQADMDLYWRYELWARRRQTEIDSIFNTTGCIYVIRRELVEPIPPDTLTDDALIPLRAFFRGYRVIFDPAAIAFDYPALAGTEFRRRYRTLAGLWQVHKRFPELFGSRNRMRWHFLSHKTGRLIMPWAILIAIGATPFMPDSPFRVFAMVAEAIPFLLAALNEIMPAEWLLKRLTSPASTFLVLNTASLLSISVFFVSTARIWKPTQVTTEHLVGGAGKH